MAPPGSTCRAHRSRTKPVGADFGKLSVAAVHLAQHLDGAHQRGGGRHALEGEGGEESRRPAPDAGIMLAEHLVGVELLRARQRLRFGDGRAEALPRDHRGDRVKGVLLVVARRDQRGADARVETHLLVDGAAIGLEGAGMPPLGLAEHRPDQPVEQIDGLVRQAGDQVEGDGDQGGMAALTLVAGDMLRRGAARLAGELGKTGLMHAMPAGRVEADRANMVQSLDQAEHGRGLCRFRHLAQPDEPALARFRSALRQRIQPPPLLGRQPVGQPTFDLSPRLIAQVDAEAFEAPGRWDDDPALSAFLHDQLGQIRQPVILNRVRQQPASQLGGRARAEGTEPKSVLQFRSVPPTVLLEDEIIVDGFRPDIDLLGNKRDQRSRRPFTDAQGTPGIAQVAKHQRVAEAVVIAATAPDRGEIRLGQRVVAHQLTLICRRIE